MKIALCVAANACYITAGWMLGQGWQFLVLLGVAILGGILRGVEDSI